MKTKLKCRYLCVVFVQLFGYFDDKLWRGGIISKLLRDASFRVDAAKSCRETFDEKKNKLQLEPPSIIQSWLVLDGALNPAWVDNMSTLLDSHQRLQLANGEQIPMHCKYSCAL